MKTLSDKEKLEKAIEFIKSIENFEYKTFRVNDIIDLECECEECGSDEIDVKVIGGDIKVLSPESIEELKNKVWHILAEIT